MAYDAGLLADEVDAVVRSAITHRVFPGAVVLLARNDRIVHHAAYGSLIYDSGDACPTQRDTLYDIASLTKVFTATAALRLFDAGLLDLSAPVCAYIPEFGTPDVTIRHLCTHTSGLNIRLSTLRHMEADALRRAAYRAAAVHPPGHVVAYTNINSLLLGDVIVRVCAQPLDVALQELVIAPLQLRDTLFCPPPALYERIAPTEFDQDWRGGLVHGWVHDESAYALGGVAGHAGLFSSAADLFTFCHMWLQDGQVSVNERPIRFLRSSTVSMACANQTADLGMACGLGWMVDRRSFMGEAPVGTFGHTGFTGPAIVIIPSEQLIIVVLSNRIYPQRGFPHHHAVTIALVNAAMRTGCDEAMIL